MLALRRTGGTAQVQSAIVDTPAIDFTQGGLVRTGRGLDLALNGKGFFVIETAAGPRYTRNGVFRTNPQGQLVDSAGRMVAGEGGPITLPPNVNAEMVSVAQDGTISAQGRALGKLRIVDFESYAGLQPVGDSLYSAGLDGEPVPAANASVQQGFQETSNVKAVEELVGLITVTRLYEANIKGIQAQDERKQNLLRVAGA